MRQRIRSGTPLSIALLVLAATACGGDEGAAAAASPDSGISADGSGTGGSAGGGNAGSGGAAAGGAGASGNAGDAGTSGGAAGTIGDSGTDGAAPRCNSCWLLVEGAGWSSNRLFFADGQRVIWQVSSTNDAITTVNVDGSNLQRFTVTGCQDLWSHPTIFGGYVYFNNISRVPMGFGPGSSCETVYTVPTTLNARAYPYFLDTFANVFWVDVYEHDMYRLVRIDMSSRFRVTDESNPNALVVRAVDASFLYGTDNPGLGSGSYRLLRYDRATKLTTVLATRIVVPDMMHVDGTSLYFASNGELYKVPKDTNVEVVPTPIPGPLDAWRILVDGSDVVYFKYGDTQFHRMPLAGGPVTTWSTGAFLMRGITWDQERYFVMVSPPDSTTRHDLVRIPK